MAQSNVKKVGEPVGTQRLADDDPHSSPSPHPAGATEQTATTPGVETEETGIARATEEDRDEERGVGERRGGIFED